MASITQVLTGLFSPQIFWPLIGGISLIFILVIIVSIFSDKKTKEADDSLRKRIKELESELLGKDAEATSLRDKFNAKEADARKQLIRLEEQINENESSKTKIKSLEALIKGKEDEFARSKNTLEESDKKLKAMQPEIDKSKKETLLKQEMYNGLKTQYDELESQVGEKTKNLQDELDKNKKLQDELKGLQLKLEDSVKKHGEALKEKEKILASQSQTKALESASIKKEEPKPAQEAIKSLEVVKENIAPVVIKEEKKAPAPVVPPAAVKEEKKTEIPAPLPVTPKEPVSQKPKSQVQVSQIEKQKSASDAAAKPKLPAKSEAKVRLAQVMQEAAKVATKIDEAKKVTENKDNPQQKKEDSENPQKDKPQA